MTIMGSHSSGVSTKILSIEGLSKTYQSGHVALSDINLTIDRGEIFALLGPNGAGKTTLIGIICGLVKLTSGRVIADGYDVEKDYRITRSLIGLVPQEISTDMFETVWNTVRFSRGLFGKGRDDAYLESVLKDLSLWEKRNSKIMTLSGGMKRRVLIAKALSHEPNILFLDEPTAGVDVELRRDMWSMVGRLRERGVTIILTTHYIEEAEEMADRIGVISNGKIILVEETSRLMKQLGKKTVTVHLKEPLKTLPVHLQSIGTLLASDGRSLSCTFASSTEDPPLFAILRELDAAGIVATDVETAQSSLEEIFVNLVHTPGSTSPAPQLSEKTAVAS